MAFWQVLGGRNRTAGGSLEFLPKRLNWTLGGDYMKEKIHKAASYLLLLTIILALGFLVIYIPELTAVHK